MSDTVHRFLWGYGADGYSILAHSPGLPSSLALDARTLFEPYDVSERRPSLISGQLEGYWVLCSAQLQQRPGKRASWERAFLLIPTRALGSVGLCSLLQLLPDSAQRGELPAPEWPPQQEPLITLMASGERALVAAWTAALHGQSVCLSGFTLDEEQQLVSALWQRVLPETRPRLCLALGLRSAPSSALSSTLLSVEEPQRIADVLISNEDLPADESGHSADPIEYFYVRYVQPLVKRGAPSAGSDPWWLRWTKTLTDVLPGSAAALLQPAVFRSIALADQVAEGGELDPAAVREGSLHGTGGLDPRVFLAWLAFRCREQPAAERLRIARELSRWVALAPVEESAAITAQVGALLLTAGIQDSLMAMQSPAPLADRFEPEQLAACLVPGLTDAALQAVHAATWSAAAMLLTQLARHGNPSVARELKAPWPDAPRLEKPGWLRRLFSRSPAPSAESETVAVLLQRWLDHLPADYVAEAPIPVSLDAAERRSESETSLVAAPAERSNQAIQSLLRGLVHTAYAARRPEARSLLVPVIQALIYSPPLVSQRAEPAAVREESDAH